MSKALSSSLALLKEMKQQFSMADNSPTPERPYGSIKRTGNVQKSKVL